MYVRPDDHASAGRRRVLIYACLALALAYLPWYNYSAVLPLVREEFALSAREAGLILSVFQLGYVLVVLFTGWLSDRLGPRTVLILSATLTGTASLGFGMFAHDYHSALVWRLLVGAGCGGLYVPGMALLSDWFPSRERAMAFGAYTGGIALGYASAYVVAGLVAGATDWRTAVLVTSLPCFAAALVYWRQVPAAPAPDREDVVRETSAGRPWRQVVRPAAFAPMLLLSIAYCAHMWEAYGYLGWAGPFYVAAAHHNGFGGHQAIGIGDSLAALAILASGVGPWAGGVLAGRLGRMRTLWLVMGISIPACFAFGWLVQLPLIALALFSVVYTAFIGGDGAIYKAWLIELLPAELRATGLAVQSAMGFGVTIAAPTAFGAVLDATNPNGAGAEPEVWGWAFVALGVGALLGPLAIFALHLVNRKRPSSTETVSPA